MYRSAGLGPGQVEKVPQDLPGGCPTVGERREPDNLYPFRCKFVMESSKTSWNFVSRLLIIGLAVVFLALILVLGFGRVEGNQISPQDFRLRSYSYYRIPGTDLQITPVKYTPIKNSLSKRLRDDGYVVGNSAIEHWDPVTYEGFGQNRSRGRAWVLVAQLETEDAEGELRWLTWTEAHPEQAKLVWKYVAEAARGGLYFVIPDLLQSAQLDPPQLEEALIQQMRVAYQQQLEALDSAQASERVTELQQALDALPTES
ncbi:MAG: hypothetical protein AAGF97_11865 [Planctomycetota bacterium]